MDKARATNGTSNGSMWPMILSAFAKNGFISDAGTMVMFSRRMERMTSISSTLKPLLLEMLPLWASISPAHIPARQIPGREREVSLL